MHGLAVRLHFHFHDTLPRIKLYKGHKKKSVSYLFFPISPQSVQWTLVANLRLGKKSHNTAGLAMTFAITCYFVALLLHFGIGIIIKIKF